MKTLTFQIPDTLDLEKESQLKQQLADHLDFLLKKEMAKEHDKSKRTQIFGCAKGKFRMADDFDAPIDHFDEYMIQSSLPRQLNQSLK